MSLLTLRYWFLKHPDINIISNEIERLSSEGLRPEDSPFKSNREFEYVNKRISIDTKALSLSGTSADYDKLEERLAGYVKKYSNRYSYGGAIFNKFEDAYQATLEYAGLLGKLSKNTLQSENLQVAVVKAFIDRLGEYAFKFVPSEDSKQYLLWERATNGKLPPPKKSSSPSHTQQPL